MEVYRVRWFNGREGPLFTDRELADNYVERVNLWPRINGKEISAFVEAVIVYDNLENAPPLLVSC